MKFVIVESPYAGDVRRNILYARALYRYCLKQGWAPYASHLNYTQPGVLNDDVPEERDLGIEAGQCVADRGDLRLFGMDYGMTTGMSYGHKRATAIGQEILEVELGENWMEEWLHPSDWDWGCPRCGEPEPHPPLPKPRGEYIKSFSPLIEAVQALREKHGGDIEVCSCDHPAHLLIGFCTVAKTVEEGSSWWWMSLATLKNILPSLGDEIAELFKSASGRKVFCDLLGRGKLHLVDGVWEIEDDEDKS